MKVKLDIILKEVCDFYSIKPCLLLGYKRAEHIKRARHIFFYLAKRYSKESYEKIGKIALQHGRNKAFDHATVLHGAKIIQEDFRQNYDISFDVEFIEKKLSNHSIEIEFSEGTLYKKLENRIRDLEKQLYMLRAS